MTAGVGAFPEHELNIMSPPREKTNDATALTVPILIVIAIVCSCFTGALTAGGVYWSLRLESQTAQSEAKVAQVAMQSDIRSIVERLDSQARVDAANKRADAAEADAQKQSYESTKAAVDSMRGVVQLLQLQVAELLKRK